MARAWTYQKKADVEKLGKRAPWYVAWIEGGKQRAKKCGLKTTAEDFRSQVASRLTAGELGQPIRIAWSEARDEYERHQQPRVRPGTMVQLRVALDHWQRLMGETPPRSITKRDIDEFATRRLSEKASRPTVNKELRTLRAFLRWAAEAKYLAEAPKVQFLRELEKLPTFIDGDLFARLYEHCSAASTPSAAGYTPEDWWRAYLVFLYLTGWRAMEPLSLKRDDLDEKAGRVLLRAENQKGGRDAWVPLHPMILDHLACVRHFGEMLLPWPHNRRRLWDEFHAIQNAAGVARPDGRPFGFHDLRRGFATANADRMTADALQVLMRHADYGTTKRYIDIARQLNPAIANLAVPTLPAKKGGAS